MSSIVDIISHYQKSIDRSLNDEARLVHCIGKLYRLPVSVQHLQETGIGRTVNGLRKYDGEVGVAAKALVSKWKNMVAAEESDTGEPEPQHQSHEEEDEDNYDESCLQVDEDRHSDDHQEEDDEDEEQHRQEEESDNQEEMQIPQEQHQVTNGHDSDHRSARSSHRDSDRHRSSSKHKSNRHSHHSSSSSKDGSRSRDRHEKHRDGENNQHHSSSSSSNSSKGHSSSSPASSTTKSSRQEHERKEKKDKHSSRKDSSHADGKESSHSSNKEKSSSSDKHHSKSKEGLNGFTKEDESHKRRRTSEDEEEYAAKKVKDDQPSESKSKSSSSSSSKERSSSKSTSNSSISSKEKDKNRSSEKKKKSSSKRKSDDLPADNSDDDNSGGGASFADALAMIGMPSSSKKKSSSKGSSDKVKITASSMPPPPAKSDKHRSSSSPSSSRSSSSKRSSSPNSTASSSGYSSCSSTPSLLAQKPKLAPLPIAEIVESLPMISPNYKPMPLNQTVMECVFSNNGKPQKRPMTEEEALGHSMQSKNLRTKVYSGVKNCSSEVPTLYSLCIRLLQEHIDLIDYTGGIPFDLLKPVLERASPDQLITLENYNSYLMEDSDVLWEQHCKRNFRCQKRKVEECESWREMYFRCSQERETKLLSLTANIKQSQVAKTAPIRKTQLAYVDSAYVKPPRNVISKQARYGTAQAPVVSPAARVPSLKNTTSNVAKAGDSRLKVAAGVRDPAQVQVFHPTKPKKAPLMSKVMQSIKGFKGFRR